MVSLEPGEPLLLYIAATMKAVSMVLVAERLDPPPPPHQLGSSSTRGSGSQDPGSTEDLGAGEPAEFQLPEDSPAHGDTGSQRPKAVLGPDDQMDTGSRALELPPGSAGWGLPDLEHMEIDGPTPPGGFGPSNDPCTMSAMSSTRPRQGT
jgi:hypothetical protein